jgi:hypothetical protein
MHFSTLYNDDDDNDLYRRRKGPNKKTTKPAVA